MQMRPINGQLLFRLRSRSLWRKCTVIINLVTSVAHEKRKLEVVGPTEEEEERGGLKV